MCPQTQFTLLDSCTKKIRIVEEITKSLGMFNVRALVGRAEQMNDKFDFLVGRGVSAVPSYLKMTAHLLNASDSCHGIGGVSSGLLYIKGGDFSVELRQAGISTFSLFPVSDLLGAQDADRNYQQLKNSDKWVLHIPSEQIAKIYRPLQRR
jgi:16S rRNA (guanine527-N7)-methyltransferase